MAPPLQGALEGVNESVEGVWRSLKVWLRKLVAKQAKGGSVSPFDEHVLNRLNIPLLPIERCRPRLVAWSKPSLGYVKLNVDGSYRGNPGSCGGGGVIQDEFGNIKGALSACFG